MSAVYDFSNKNCNRFEGRVAPMSKKEIEKMLDRLDGWKEKSGSIEKSFLFPDYNKVVDFVNATASISHSEGHHPDIELYYDRCIIKYTTHDINGLSEKDFICAEKIDDILRQR